jgi:hypothetical protein
MKGLAGLEIVLVKALSKNIGQVSFCPTNKSALPAAAQILSPR